MAAGPACPLDAKAVALAEAAPSPQQAQGSAVRGSVTGWFLFPLDEEPPSIERRRVDERVLAVRERVLDVTEKEERSAAGATRPVPLIPGARGRQGLELDGWQSELAGEVLDMEGVPLRWGRERSMRRRVEAARRLLEATAMLDAPRWVPARGQAAQALGFSRIVKRYAADYGLKTHLLLAIIQVESLGDVRCVSGKCATGLMQIQPHTAGQEVAAFLKDRPASSGQKQQDLFSPEQNIRYGAAYLHILATRYFGQVTDPLSREFCVITAYNSGPGRFYGYFGKSRKEAFARINALSPEELFRDISTRIPVKETRTYLGKVYALMNYYQSLGY